MATTAPPAPSHAQLRGVQPLQPGVGHSFLWRKLHSLSGIIPIGAFLVEHIVSNFEALNGPLAYANRSCSSTPCPSSACSSGPSSSSRSPSTPSTASSSPSAAAPTSTSTPGPATGCTSSQRITGLIAFVYIIQHVWRQRFSGVSLPEHPGAAFAKVQHELSNPWMLAIYVIAMIATTWHFAYGIWLFAAKWGITPGDKARKRFGYVCAAVGIALCLMGLASIYAFVGNPHTPTPPKTSCPTNPPA